MSKTSYAEKLKDPRWQKKRLEIFERDGWRCRNCQDTTTTLHIHHLRYIPGKEPWDYDERLLVTLCESCHELEKEARREYEYNLLDILKDQGFLADSIYAITSGFVGLRSQYPSDVTATIIEKTLRSDKLWGKVCKNYFEGIRQVKKPFLKTKGESE